MSIVKHSSTLSTWKGRSVSLLLILTAVFVWIPAAEACNEQSLRETPLIDFQIPAQTLTSALTQFATQSKLFLV
ncbi:MAG: hypothetical protein NPIRA02_38200 [Nitrospirales bacterium]|nr:MAG: hypothetical protein NPIRA02_38200 [Nitrospirales bacterium]